MLIAFPKEIHPEETRTACTPEVIEKLIKWPISIGIETGAGLEIYKDADFQFKNTEIYPNRTDLLKNADIILGVHHLDETDISHLKSKAISISLLDPFFEMEIVEAFAKQEISAMSMQMLPRISRAQTMDALSSQASLAGYESVILAAEHSHKIFPMMITAAGTILPTKVLVIGAGVAGLQAIATAKRLGARVFAFDTRPEVEEQVESLGAKFVKIDIGKTEKTEDGYAKPLTPEQLDMQKAGLAKVCSESDIIITTALIFGRKAPIIITKEMIAAMKPNTIIVDMAVESGGNVEGSVLNEETLIHDVQILGYGNLPGRVPINASEMYANNLYHLLDCLWHPEHKTFELNLEDTIIQNCLITHKGKIVHPEFEEKTQ